MNIAILCYPTYGGSGVVASELGLALADRGHQVHFFSTSRPFRLPGFHANIFFHEVPVVHYPLFEHTPYMLTLASTLYESIQRHRLEIIHAHYAIPHATAAYLAQQMGGGAPPVVTTLHGTDITLVGSHPAYVPVVKFTIDHSDHVTAVSEFLARETRERIGTEREICVIPNFVNGKTFSRHACTIRKKLFAPSNEPVIVHISNFRPVKRVGDVLETFIKVRKRTPCKLVLAGDGPDRAKAEQTARDGGVMNDVIFLGKQEAVVDLLGIADVYFLPSNAESFGLSALEAMACEVPVVAARAGGIPEVVEDGKTGFLTAVGDTEEMAARILQLVQDDGLRQRMGRASRARALSAFPEERVVAQYESVYRDLISSG